MHVIAKASLILLTRRENFANVTSHFLRPMSTCHNNNTFSETIFHDTAVVVLQLQLCTVHGLVFIHIIYRMLHEYVQLSMRSLNSTYYAFVSTILHGSLLPLKSVAKVKVTVKVKVKVTSVLFSSWSNKNYSNSEFNAFCYCCCCWQVDFTKNLVIKNILFETKRNIENANLVFFLLFFWTMMMANFFMWLKLRLHMPSTSPFCERHLWSSWRYP